MKCFFILNDRVQNVCGCHLIYIRRWRHINVLIVCTKFWRPLSRSSEADKVQYDFLSRLHMKSASQEVTGWLFLYVSVKPQTPTVSGSSSLTDGDTANLTCTTASSLSTGVTYEWLLAGTAISGATSSPYTTAVAMTDDGNAYTCKVTFNGVTSDVSSNTVTLTGEHKSLIWPVSGKWVLKYSRCKGRLSKERLFG